MKGIAVLMIPFVAPTHTAPSQMICVLRVGVIITLRVNVQHLRYVCMMEFTVYLIIPCIARPSLQPHAILNFA
jgi:hypothetical protein